MNSVHVDPAIFSELGIVLPQHQQLTFTTYFLERLEERIGQAIIELLDETQTAELVHLQQTADSETVADWIRTYVPDYALIAQDEFDILMGEVAENADTISAR